MTCYSPLTAFRSAAINPETGRRGITFNSKYALIEAQPFKVPCGSCTGCKIDRSRAWGIRCMHESQMHPQNTFLTLTYSNEAVPNDFSVKLDDYQKFLKRLRFHTTKKIRFFGCGEYGDQNLRPHYHLLIFNYDFSDKIPSKKILQSKDEYPTFTSNQLSQLWPHGNHEIGTVTFKSACYVARYSFKKINGDNADSHYFRRSPIDGKTYRVSSEFCTQSKGLGQSWFDKYKSDVFPCDFLVIDGKKVKPPRYYLNQLKEDLPIAERKLSQHGEKYAVQNARRQQGKEHAADNTPERLRVREIVHDAKLKILKRTI
jgi:hypothetical protein